MTDSRGWNVARSCALGILLLLFCNACGAGGSKQLSASAPGIGATGQSTPQSRFPTVHPVKMAPQPSIPAGFDTSALPAPSELAAASASGLTAPGAQFAAGGLGATASDGYAVLDAGAGPAWAAYRLDFGSAEAKAGRQTVGLTWDAEREPELGQLWLGLSRGGTWEWFGGFEDNVLTVESLEQYADNSAAGSVLIALTGGPVAALERVTLGQPEVVGSGFLHSPVPVVGTRQVSLKQVSDYPASYDLSAEFPPIHYQGSVGACTAFAVGDGAFNYELGQLYGAFGWDFADDFNLVSPRYLYIETGTTQGYGCPDDGRYLGSSTGVVQWLQDASHGVATELNADYDADPFCDDTWSAEALADADILRSAGSETITAEVAATIDAIKSVLVDDVRPVIIGMAIDDGFSNYDGTPEVWEWTGPSIGGHAVLIVGYDDSKNAFKIRNSWSEFWGIDGYGWVGFDTLSTDTDADPELYDLWATFDTSVMERFCPSAPDPPANVAATDGTLLDRVRVTWDAAVSADSYKVYRATSQNGTYTQVGSSTTATQMDISTNTTTTYWFKVVATNTIGDSAMSTADSGNAGLAAPTNVAATDGTRSDSVRITWSSVANADYYRVYRATSAGGTYTVLGDVTSTQYDDIISGTTVYWYRVRAGITGQGLSAYSAYNSGYAGVQTPNNVNATDGTLTDRIRISWDAVSGSVLDYRVYRAASANGTYSLLGYTTGTQFDDPEAVTTVYYYKVTTRMSLGESAASAANAGNAGLATPTNFAASDGTYTSYVRLSWSAVSGASDYRLYRSTTSNGTYTLIASTTSTAYNYTESSNAVFYYKIRARNGSGYSQYSAAEAGNAGINAPTNLAASDGTFTDRIRVTWTAASGADFYQIWRSTAANGTYTLVGSTGSTQFDNFVGDTTTYYYKVRSAVSFVGYSAYAGPDSGFKGP